MLFKYIVLYFTLYINIYCNLAPPTKVVHFGFSKYFWLTFYTPAEQMQAMQLFHLLFQASVKGMPLWSEVKQIKCEYPTSDLKWKYRMECDVTTKYIMRDCTRNKCTVCVC